jgi:hypothetical protein
MRYVRKKITQITRKLKYEYKVNLSKLIRLQVIILYKYLKLDRISRTKAINGDIQIILDPVNKGWVIEKLARKIIEFYPNHSKIKIHYFPRPGYLITHWMHYLNVSQDFLRINSGVNSFLVPHVDTKEKENFFLKNLEFGGIPIFMSEQHSRDIAKRLNLRFNPHYILPGSDLAEGLARFRIIIASHIYPDGRKNEKYLVQLAHDLSLENTHFTFVGKNWAEVSKALKDAGASVDWMDPNKPNFPTYLTLNLYIKSHDLFVYLGNDEGSLGALDAYLLGVPLLISNQGFHQEFIERNNVEMFETYEDFKIKFQYLSQTRNRIDYDNWSWSKYSKQHQKFWDSLVLGELNRKI